MAGKGINIQFLSDVSGFLRGTKDVGTALEKVGDSLDDLTKDAAKAGDGFGDGLKDGAKDAERAVDDLGDSVRKSLDQVDDQARDAGKAIGNELEDGAEKAEDATKSLERKFRDVFDTVSDTSRKAGDDLGDNVKRGADKAGEGLDNMKDEAADTARETAASFDGSADSIVDMFQETAANAFIGFGPAGAAAGLAVAAGAGLAYTYWQEQAEKIEARVRSMYDDMLESGNRFLSAQYVNQGISEILNDDENAIIGYARAQEIAARTGLALSTVVRAYAGDADAAAQVSGILNGQLEAQGEGASSTTGILTGMRDQLDAVTESTGTAAEKAGAYYNAIVPTAEAARDFAAAQADAGEATRDALAAIEENNTALAGNAEQLRTQNLGALADYAAGLVDVQEKGREAGVSTSELTALQITQAGQFVATAGAAGIAEGAALDLAVQYGLIPRDVATAIREQGGTAAITTAEQVRDAVNAIPNSKTITISTVRTYSNAQGPAGSTGDLYSGYASGGYVGGFPDGGMVGGPGGPIDDRVLARLSRGEYVLDAQSAQQIGTGRLDQLNNGQFGPAGSPGTLPSAAEIGRAVGEAVAAAIDGSSLTITGGDVLFSAVMARLRVASRQRYGVRGSLPL